MIAISFQEAVLNNLNSEIIVTDEEVQDYYQQNKDQFLLDERMSGSVILLLHH